MIASNVPFRKIFNIETLPSFFSEFESNLNCGSFKSYKNPSQLILNSWLEFSNFFYYFSIIQIFNWNFIYTYRSTKFSYIQITVTRITTLDASKRNCSSIMYMYLVRDNDLYWSNIISSPQFRVWSCINYYCSFFTTNRFSLCNIKNQ